MRCRNQKQTIVHYHINAKAFIKSHLGFCRQMISREMFWILTYNNLRWKYICNGLLFVFMKIFQWDFRKQFNPICFWSFIEPLFQVPFGVVNFTTCIQSPYAVEDRNNKINCNDRCVFSEFYYILLKKL